MDMNEVIKNVTLTKVCSIRPFKNSDEVKHVTLAIKYDGLTIGDVLAKALRQDVIAWQNGPGRKNFDKLVNGSTVNVNASRPGATTVDPETAMVAKLMAMTPDEQQKYLNDLAKKVRGTKGTEKVKIRKKN